MVRNDGEIKNQEMKLSRKLTKGDTCKVNTCITNPISNTIKLRI